MSDELLRTLLGKVDSLVGEVADLKARLEHRERVLTGWSQIAEYLGLSASRAQHLGADPEDPIPYSLQGGTAVALATMLDAWQHRRTLPAQRGRRREQSRGQLDLFRGPRRGRSDDGQAS